MPDWLSKIVISILAMLTIVFLFVVVSANADLIEEAELRAALIANAPKSLPLLKEFERLFSDTEHKIISGYHLFPDGESRWVEIWNGHAWFHDRHALEMNFPFDVTNDGTIEPLDEPTFFFSSLAASGRDDEGLWFRLGESRSFEVNDWRKLVDSDGDFSLLGLTITEDSPIEHFEQWKRY